MSSRRKARELALQLLFQYDLNQFAPRDLIELFWKVHPSDTENRDFAEFLFSNFLEHHSQVDGLISRHAKNWRLDRMAVVDRNILRMAIIEFLYAETPKVVVIDEAIEIARRFSTEESTQFVNGLLDAIRQEVEMQITEEG